MGWVGLMLLLAGTYFWKCLYVALLWTFNVAHPVDVVYNPNPSTGRTHDMILNFSQKNRRTYFDTKLPIDLSDYDFYACRAGWEDIEDRGSGENSTEVRL